MERIVRESKLRPYASGAGWELYMGDCVRLMPDMSSSLVDAVLTDPPYGVGFKDQAWDSRILAWLDDARRIGKIVAFTTAPTTQWDYPRPDWVNCYQRPAAQSRTASGGFCHWTPVLVYGKVKFPVDCFRLNAQTAGCEQRRARNTHPSPKPVSLMQWLVENCSPGGGTVLDPFSGSGTTGIACLKSGRRFLGIEENEQYCELAARRLQDASGSQVTLN